MDQSPLNVIGAAWRAAHQSNEAFDALRDIEEIAKQLHNIGRLGLEGVHIDEHVHEDLKAKQAQLVAEFEALVAQAAPAMLQVNSPFDISQPPVGDKWQPPQRIILSGERFSAMTRPEYEALKRAVGQLGIQITAIEQPTLYANETLKLRYNFLLHQRPDMDAFALAKRYNSRLPTRVFSVLTREAVQVKAQSFAKYEADTQTAPPNFLTAVETPDGKIGLDIRPLYLTARKWVNGACDIPYFSDAHISFVADYVNHALLELEEPLPVKHPPRPDRQRPATDGKLAELLSLAPRELLLDVLNRDDPTRRFVTAASIRRHLFSQRLSFRNFNSIALVFEDLCRYADPKFTGRPYDERFKVDPQALHYEGEGDEQYSAVRGIEPDVFQQLVAQLELDNAEIKSYGKKHAEYVHHYLKALQALQES